jgi:hypothetical protein
MNKICLTCNQETLLYKCCNKRTSKRCNIEGCKASARGKTDTCVLHGGVKDVILKVVKHLR